MNIEDMILEKVKEKFSDEKQTIWLLIYDFKEVRSNSSKVRKFYREIKNSNAGARKTNSEIVFENVEDALEAKRLAIDCGANASLYASIEI